MSHGSGLGKTCMKQKNRGKTMATDFVTYMTRYE